MCWLKCSSCCTNCSSPPGSSSGKGQFRRSRAITRQALAAGASGNVATEDVVWLLNGLGIDTGIDLDALVDTAAWISAQLGREPASRVARAVLAKRAKAACAS